ncbi:UDP-N-acetylglucosamine--N-acetylmuramyl-(pentapeptide) pyrophosphoryl-undecaprenol N-acetylglucosamine transferase [Candidatus Wolfebacteria bacterium]|nr:UDP-N-acetylglucosamine--N-acetylmuramyl-(pentapeptide) pyrophosphoryl-undecaprenol N-acetylglucosamine transferase [Candidatus Wolfebacteria bacterium]
MLRILLTGGGSGGHIYPLIAVSEELRNIAGRNNIALDIRYCGAPGSFGGILVSNNIEVRKIIGSKWRRYFDFRNFLDIPKFFLGVIQAIVRVFVLMPDVLFSKGGPGSFPVVFACWFYRIPIFIHESDTVLGISNALASRFARWIGLAFDSAENLFTVKGAVVAVVGNPIRQSLFAAREEQGILKKMLGFRDTLPLILVMGSSQGAQRINEFVLDAAPLLTNSFQILHQTGLQNFDLIKQEAVDVMKDAPPEERARYQLVPYLHKNYPDAIFAADIIVSRASSSSIFEIAASAKPSILIPLPEAAGDHQRMNAYEYSKTGAAVVVENENLTPHVFETQVRQLIANPDRLRAMSDAARGFAKPDAARLIAEAMILEMKR